MRDVRKLPLDEFLDYLNALPLEPPESYDPVEAFKQGVETGNWRNLETVARKVCRLIIGATGRDREVRGLLRRTEKQYDQAYGKLIKTLGERTPSLAQQINELRPSEAILGWAVYGAKYVAEGERKD